MIPFVLDKDAKRCAIEILELTLAERPKEGGKSKQAKPERDRNEEDKTVHRIATLRRRALPTTRSEDPDMAIAATSGVTSPRKASGTAMTL